MLKKTLVVAITFLGAAAGVLSAQAPLTDSARVRQIVGAMNAAVKADSPAVARKALDSLTRELDRVPGQTEVKLIIHASVLGFYEDFDDDTRIADQVRDIKALAAQLTPDQRAHYAKAIVAAYLSQAKLQGNHLHIDSALAILDQASAVLPGVADSLGVAKDRAMYKLVGTQAPVLHADYWINGPAKPFAGTPTMLMFTGEWCHSCRDAYPTVGAVQQEFAPKGVQTVLALELIGNFDGHDVTPDQEVDDNRHYYADEHHFAMPIAVQRGRDGGSPPADQSNTQAFEVHYWPMFLVIDRHGVIRGILQGWDPYGSRGEMLKKLIGITL